MEIPNKGTARLRSSKGNQINWNQVFFFSEVATHGSVRKAAELLDLSPSTLSEHIAQLEKDLDVQLFHRQHRKLMLTEQGSRLYQYSKQMFEAGQRILDVVSPLSLGYYPISVGLVPNPSVQVAYKILRNYLAAYGPLDMKLMHSRHEDLERGLAEARFDFGFSDRPTTRKDLRSRLIHSSGVSFYVHPKWAMVELSRVLSELPLLICNSEPATREFIEQQLADAEITPCAVISSEYPSVLLNICQHGQGVGLFSDEVIREINVKTLTSLRVPPESPKLRAEAHVLWSQHGENSESVKHLRTLISTAPITR